MNAIVGLALFLTFIIVCFGLRTFIMWRETGSTGWQGFSGRVGSVEWWGGVCFALALLLGIAAPVLALLNILTAKVSPIAFAAGVFTCAVGILGTFWAQLAMGRSWRIGVDESEQTALVSQGPFRWVRNPIFSFVLLTGAGLVLLVPNPLAVASFCLLLLAVEIQVRRVEEPYLIRTHGDEYLRYAAKVGRFLPGLGRLAGKR